MMKILIVSDTHGSHAGIREAIAREKPIQLLIHLGDAEGFENDYARLAGCPIEAVAGNVDSFSRLPKEKELRIGDLRVFITHGHYYYVSLGYDEIRREGLRRHADVVMFGHTHRPMLEEGRVTLVNPGSISYPRQADKTPSYVVMEADPGKKPRFEIRYL